MSKCKFPHVFSPLKLRSVTLKNRIEFTPMVSCLSNAAGEVTEEYLEFIRMQARSGVSQIIIGDTQIDWERPVCFYGELNVQHDRYVTALSLIPEVAHEYGAKMSIEIAHAGKGGVPSMNTKPGFSSSYLPTPGRMQDIKVMDRADMDYVIGQFVDCCKRVKAAGFDLIFIHAGHNNLFGQFLSPASNIRTDEYGGSMENRMRFPLEILKAIREAVGEDFPLEMRVSAEEMTDTGEPGCGPESGNGCLKPEHTLAFLKEAQKYIDMAHISCGNVFVEPGVKYSVPLYLQERQQNVKYAAMFKKELDIPVSVVGNIMSLEEAEEIIASGKADMVGMCRSLMADPELIHNAVKGCSEDTRPCLRCMDGCGRIFFGLPVRCAVNPIVGREYKYPEGKVEPARKKKKVVIVGGGPAGMQAAQTAVDRGHDVVLFEKDDCLGGMLHDASAVPFKDLMRNYTEWMVRTTMKCGADIRLNTAADKATILAEKPDEVIIATGSQYFVPPIPGVDGPNVVSLSDAENRRAPIGQKVVICGAGLSGIECSVGLSREGKEVTVVDMIPVEDFCSKMFAITRKALFDEVWHGHVQQIGNSKVVEINTDGVVIETEGEKKLLPCDTVITAFGLKSVNNLFGEMLEEMPLNTYCIGDADGVETVRKATKTGFDIAARI
ncbi:oxidoreductase [Intestinibacillus sp. Marseille-P6563]|uniref:oxidoreductase n=1 Tax=Intestinibacillus sp. Marseille-P6563 TaxID=2364792 RepID=UPI000F04BC8D|nr:FAD-dependent oxidoreductase [Intestinibacillus sp. Marseille-P6563]